MVKNENTDIIYCKINNREFFFPESRTFEFSIRNSVVSTQTEHVSGLHIENIKGKKCIAWNPTPNSCGYKVYARTDRYSPYFFLTDTSDAWFLTDVDWSPEIEDGYLDYYVAPVLEYGVGSLSGPALIESGMRAAFTFTNDGNVYTFKDESKGRIEEWRWDFDSDGITDSLEQNPTYVAPDNVKMNVSLTIINDQGADSATYEGAIKTGKYVDHLEVSSKKIDVKVGENFKLPVKAVYNDGSSSDATDKCEYVGYTDLLDLSDEFIFKAFKSGTTVIICKYENNDILCLVHVSE